MFGSLVSRLALPFVVIFTMHATASQVALLRVCELLPGIVIGLFAGVWVDRLRRRRVMIFSDVVRALLVGSIPLLLFLHHASWPQILLTAVVVSMFTVTFDSAFGAYVPTLVNGHEITNANSKLASTSAIAEVVGFGFSGALFEWLGGVLTLSIDALSFVFSAMALVSIRKPEAIPPRDREQESLRDELVQGLRYLYGNKQLSVLCGIAGIVSMFYGISGTVYLLYISRELHVVPAVQGMLYAVGGVAAFAMSALADSIFQKIRFGSVLVWMSLFGVIGFLVLPLASGPMWVLILCVLTQQVIGDGADTVFEIGVSSFRQTQTTNQMLGRVNSIWLVITSACLLAGTVLGGELATVMGLRNTLFVAVFVRVIVLGLTVLSPARTMQRLHVESVS